MLLGALTCCIGCLCLWKVSQDRMRRHVQILTEMDQFLYGWNKRIVQQGVQFSYRDVVMLRTGYIPAALEVEVQSLDGSVMIVEGDITVVKIPSPTGELIEMRAIHMSKTTVPVQIPPAQSR
eukprot:TRINITY_DN745_c0_g3_i2.p1 TRINITY_DN745_c0_g3~~TRINITY_DN745_c0_g3_i2.p1  ORF type:complete len:122 (-),score=24.09 TRINITY_DN745_c0_g3_i2:120-485(-)